MEGKYYIDRSPRLTPCWDTSGTLEEAHSKAKKWAVSSNCYVAIRDSSENKIALYDENGNIIK